MYRLDQMSSEQLGERVARIFARFRGHCSKLERDAVEELIRRAINYDRLVADSPPDRQLPS